MVDVFGHDDYVNVDVTKTGDNSSLHLTVIKAMKLLHEQGFIPVEDNACILIVYQWVSFHNFI